MELNYPVYESVPENCDSSLKLIKRGCDHLVVSFPAIDGYQSYRSLTQRVDVDQLVFKCEEKSWMTKGDGT